MSNRLIIVKDGKEREATFDTIPGLKINCFGDADNNVVKIWEPYDITNLAVLFSGCDNRIEIHSNSTIRSATVFMGAGAKNRLLSIGERMFLIGVQFHLVTNGSTITVGDDCLFSADVVIAADDGHPVYDIFSKELLNKGGKINIGNCVWLGYGTIVCKNVDICNHVVVGANSIVTRSISEEYSITAGSPAKVIKKGYDFSKLTVDRYIEQLESDNIGK